MFDRVVALTGGIQSRGIDGREFVARVVVVMTERDWKLRDATLAVLLERRIKPTGVEQEHSSFLARLRDMPGPVFRELVEIAKRNKCLLAAAFGIHRRTLDYHFAKHSVHQDPHADPRAVRSAEETGHS